MLDELWKWVAYGHAAELVERTIALVYLLGLLAVLVPSVTRAVRRRLRARVRRPLVEGFDAAVTAEKFQDRITRHPLVAFKEEVHGIQVGVFPTYVEDEGWEVYVDGPRGCARTPDEVFRLVAGHLSKIEAERARTVRS